MVWGPLGDPLAWAAGCLLKLTQAIILWGVAQPWGHRFVVGPAWGWVLVFYALLGLAAVVSTITARRAQSPQAGRLRKKQPLVAAGGLGGPRLAPVGHRRPGRNPGGGIPGRRAWTGGP